MEPKVIKYVGIAATMVGTAATLVGNWVDEKKMNMKIIEEVTKQLQTSFSKKD